MFDLVKFGNQKVRAWEIRVKKFQVYKIRTQQISALFEIQNWNFTHSEIEIRI